MSAPLQRAADGEPSPKGALPPAGLRPGAGPGLAARLVLAGLGLLAALGLAILLWRWHERDDGFPLALVLGGGAEAALAAGFAALGVRAPAASRLLERAFIGAGLLALFFLLPHELAGDDITRFNDIQKLLTGHGLTHSSYSLVMPLVSVPVLELGRIVETQPWWAAHFNVLVVAAGLAAGFRLLRERLEPALLRRVALVLLFASFLPNRLRDYNAEVLTATLVGLGIICLATSQHVRLGWAAIVVGTVNTPALIVPLFAIACFETIRTRRARNLAPVLAAALLIVLEAWVRRGSPLDTGYAHNHGVQTIMPYSGLPEFSYPFLLGVAAILFSFGRGLLFFMPGLALWLDAGTRRVVPLGRAAPLMLVFTAGLVAVYAKWWAWYGGIGWGPRFFLFAALPASLFLAVRIQQAGRSARADALTLAVLVLSAWVACAGAIADLGTLNFCKSNGYQYEQLCWFTPDFSSLWQPVRSFPVLSSSTLLLALLCGVVFAYLAAPLLVALARSLRPRTAWLAGWGV